LFSLTSFVAVVTKVYVLSGLSGIGTFWAHTKKLRASRRPSSSVPSSLYGLHLPWISAPLAVVLITNSFAPS